MENTLMSETINSSTRGILAKPSYNKRQTWVSLVENVIKTVDGTDVKLTSSLVSIREAEEIPVKWNRVNKPKFMVFLNNINGYQGNSEIDEQSWALISNALKQERDHEAKNNTKNEKNKHTVNKKIKFREDGNSKSDDVMTVNQNLKLKKEADCSRSQVKGSLFEEKKLARKLAKKSAKRNSAKQKLVDNAEWTNMVQSLVEKVGDDNEDLISHLQRISHAPNIPHKVKWRVMNRPNFMTFLMNIPAYKVDPTIIDRLWSLMSKCLSENLTKKKKKIKPEKSSGSSKKVEITPKESERKQTWKTIFQDIMLNNEDKQLTKSLQIICEAERIPRHLNKLNRDKFMTFLQNVPSFQVNSEVDEKIWSLLCKAIEEKMKNEIPKVSETKQEDMVMEKGSKRKGALMHDSFFSSKKMKKEPRSFLIKECSSNSGITQTEEADHPTNFARSPHGKNVLQDCDDNELPVKKSGKKKSRINI